MKDMLLQAMDERQFGLFVAAAKGFRSGSIDEAAFLKACASSFGKRMPHIFPEFVTLLPDIPKQRQLYFVAKDAEVRRTPLLHCGPPFPLGQTPSWGVAGTLRNANVVRWRAIASLFAFLYGVARKTSST